MAIVRKFFAHSQFVIMHKKIIQRHPCLKKLFKKFMQVKIFSCGNCKTNFENSKAMVIHEKIMQDQTFSCNAK